MPGAAPIARVEGRLKIYASPQTYENTGFEPPDMGLAWLIHAVCGRRRRHGLFRAHW